MFKHRLHAVALVLLLLCGAVARAEDATVPASRVSLQAAAVTEIPNDTMRALMFTEAEDANAAKLADLVNKTLTEASKTAHAQPGVKVKTGNYQTYPVYDNRSHIARWRVRADLSLESRDFKALATLLAKLQGAMGLTGIEFFASDESRRKAENDLMIAAIVDFKRRAEVVTKALDAKDYRIVELVVNPDNVVAPEPRPMTASRAAPALSDVAPAQMDAGTSRINVIVSGTVSLVPGEK
ncbi:MAG: DUF541 domain-containing protein [Betaproteobacteria bacterium]|nr:DUF541 domain-containing protein [Betaproteobacteria bacterium]